MRLCWIRLGLIRAAHFITKRPSLFPLISNSYRVFTHFTSSLKVSRSGRSSGVYTKQAPVARAPIIARYPHLPPCVSTMKIRLRLAEALCLIASQASTKAFKLVSLPRLNSVNGTLQISQIISTNKTGNWILVGDSCR